MTAMAVAPRAGMSWSAAWSTTSWTPRASVSVAAMCIRWYREPARLGPRAAGSVVPAGVVQRARTARQPGDERRLFAPLGSQNAGTGRVGQDPRFTRRGQSVAVRRVVQQAAQSPATGIDDRAFHAAEPRLMSGGPQ